MASPLFFYYVFHQCVINYCQNSPGKTHSLNYTSAIVGANARVLFLTIALELPKTTDDAVPCFYAKVRNGLLLHSCKPKNILHSNNECKTYRMSSKTGKTAYTTQCKFFLSH